MNLVLLEAVGKQAFIFESNQLRQNLGASQMVYESTTSVLHRVLGDLAVDTDGDDPAVRVIIATSGKAMLLCHEIETARRIVWHTSATVAAELPGVRVVGVIQPFDWGHGIGDASQAAHRRLDEVAAAAASPRFLRLPVNEDCALSGTVAATRRRIVNDELAISHPAAAKEAARRRGIDRLKDLVAIPGGDVAVAEGVADTASVFDDLDVSWTAVVHADGNGLGAVFSDFDTALARAGLAEANGTIHDDVWVEWFQKLSIAVEEVTLAAFRAALDAVPARTWRTDGRSTVTGRAVVPIVLGGDDLTAVCTGADAWAFATVYMREFARFAAENDVVARLLPEPLTASGGIAYTKQHFPFSDAYRLADALAGSAKGLKPTPAVDFHVLYDSSTEGLTAVRANRTFPDRRLHGGPYDLAERAARLDAFARAIDARVDNRRAIPSSQLHRIRSTATRSVDAASREWTALRGRVGALADELPERLFAVDDDSEIPHTMLLDALALADVNADAPA